eukprot:5434436-Amphidinium_carterae.1
MLLEQCHSLGIKDVKHASSCTTETVNVKGVGQPLVTELSSRQQQDGAPRHFSSCSALQIVMLWRRS